MLKHKNEMEISNVLSFIESIPERMLGGDQPRFLFDLSFELEGKAEIVEIGTSAGKSLIALAYAQKIKENGKKIYSIDIHQHKDLKDNLRKIGVEDWVTLIIGHSSGISKKWNRPIELLWIDSDHCYIGTKFTIKKWSKFIIEGGYIAFHDYGTEFIGVTKAIRRYILSKPNNWKIVNDRESGSIFVAQKINKNKKTIQRKIREIKRENILNLRAIFKRINNYFK